MLTHLLLSVALAGNEVAAPSTLEIQGREGPHDGGQHPPGPPPPHKGGQHKKPQPHWKTEPFVNPEAGAQVNSNGGTTTTYATLGASAGYRYMRVGDPPPLWGGMTRVHGAYGTGGDTTSLDARVGTFFGPHWKTFALQFGPDLFWNKAESSDGRGLEPSVGVDFPLMANVKLSKELMLLGGVCPAWLANPDRKVDWSQVDVPGFGDEFAYMAGINLKINQFAINASYNYRIVATGVQHSVGLGVNFGL